MHRRTASPFAAGLAVTSALMLTLVLAACAPASEEPEVAFTIPGGTLPPTTAVETAAGKPCVAATDVPPAEGKPEVDVPEGPPPTELVITDLIEGEGDPVATGDTVTMQYVGISCSTGKQFDSSWDRGAPFETELVEGALIQGWIDGVPGMKAGGRRLLVIPPELGYGDTPNPGGGIAPGETLVFVVDVVSFEPAGGSGEPAGSEGPAGTVP